MCHRWDDGWTRWLLEDFGFVYKSVNNSDIQAGGLKQRFDVIVLPDAVPAITLEGHAQKEMPEAYTGGIGKSGIAALQQFANAGGTILCLNRSATFCVEQLGVKVTETLKGVSNKEFYSPGSLLNIKLDTSSPLTRGLPAEITIWNEGSPTFDAEEQSVGNYPADGILASGWLLGAKRIANKSALVDANVGSGHVVLFGMRPQYRAQSYQTFKLLFNGLVYN